MLSSTSSSKKSPHYRGFFSGKEVSPQTDSQHKDVEGSGAFLAFFHFFFEVLPALISVTPPLGVRTSPKHMFDVS